MTQYRYRPSSAHRFMECPASVVMESGLVDRAGIDAQYGIAAHSLAAMVLRDEIPHPSAKLDETIDGIVVDEEMVENIDKYCTQIRSFMPDGGRLLIESRFSFSELLGLDEQGGTADAVIIDTKTKTVQVHDLKYGRGVRVYAKNNPQCMLYAIGVLEMLEPVLEAETIQMYIHQVRLDHLDAHELKVSELKKFGKKFKKQVDVIEKIRHEYFNPGTSQCKFCKAKPFCPSIRDSVEETIGTAFVDMDAETMAAPEIDVGTLPDVLTKLDMIRDWCNAVENFAYEKLMVGGDIPGFKLVLGQAGRRKWADPEGAESQLKNLGVSEDDLYTKKLASPTQIQKILAKDDFVEMESYIVRGDAKPIMVPAIDKRSAFVPEAATMFENLETETEN